VPSPGGGGTVGRTKVSDDNSPLPRDRIIFDYDHFNGVNLGVGRIDVNRFSVGIEKTCFDQRASVEVRLPFAVTMTSDLTADATNPSRAELGNVNVTFKALLLRGEAWNVAAGVGMSLPTGDDVRVRFADGTQLVHIGNEGIILTPYLAVLYTPYENLFAQAWVAYGFDATGNPVQINSDGTGLRGVGRYNDQTLLQVDAQLGCWLYQNVDPDSSLQGLASFVEMHYNGTVTQADVLTAGNMQFGMGGNLDEVNVTAGMIAQLYSNCNLAMGVVVPLRNRPNQTFEYQVGIHGNWFFGPTARNRSAAQTISSF
jgi:hypothetical protein